MTASDGEMLDLRVLILAPTGKDAVLTAAVLAEAKIQSLTCPDIECVERAVKESSGALLVAEEALVQGGLEALAAALSHQPTWSDLPVLLLTRYGADSAIVGQALQALGNVTLLERPVRPATLISAARAALKARERQYQVRTHLAEQERTNAALEESEGRLRAIVQQAMAGIAQCDLNGQFLLVNRRFCEIVGYSREELLQLRQQDLSHPEDRQRNADEFSRHVAEQSGYLIEKRYVRQDGRIVWVRNSVAVLCDSQGKAQSMVAVVIDVTDSKHAEEQIRFQAQLLDAVGQAAIATDANGKVIYWNRFAETLYGWPAAEAAGRSIVELIVDDTAALQANEIMDVLRKGQSWSGEMLVRHRSGKSFPAFVTDTPLLDSHGALQAVIGVSTDITERKRVEETLREADRRKDEFLATLAHELRNPLAPIRNSLHILRLSAARDPAAEQVCEMMERQVGHLVRLVDDLMEVSRITRGQVELRTEPVELAAVIRSAVEASRPLIEASRHQLAISLPAEPLIIQGDPVRLSQVIANLLNNAAKYMDEGGQIWLVAKQSAGAVSISIRDTGIGIPAEMLPHIFKMFTQVDRSTRQAQGGLGIGLTLVRTLVEMHGGQVEAYSAGVGQGSEFVVQLPVSKEAGVAERAAHDARASVLPNRRVLVVDDNRDAASSLALLLKLLGAEVQVANDGPSALEMLPAYRPTVVLLDIGMPGMDGYEVARRMRKQPEGQDLMLIALTGWGQEEDRRRTNQAGFNHHLIKPADVNALKSLFMSLGNEEKVR
jgi:PAS domain S-box-containing protein